MRAGKGGQEPIAKWLEGCCALLVPDIFSKQSGTVELYQVQNGNRGSSKDLQDVAEVVRLPTPQASTRILTNSATQKSGSESEHGLVSPESTALSY